MLILYILLIFLSLFILYNLAFFIFNFKNKILSFILKLFVSFLIFYGSFLVVKKFNLADFKFYCYISIPAFLIAFIIDLFSKKETKKEVKDKMQIVLEHENGKIIYDNPFNGFIIYGGAEAGKTLSIGKPLLKEYMRNNFGFFIYDAKLNDYTLTALELAKKYDYQKPIYYFDFVDPSRSYRTNLFSRENITNDMFLEQYATIFFDAYLKEDEKKTEWYSMALQMFIGVSYVFYNKFPEYCTLPHICNFILHNNDETIIKFLDLDDKAKGFASTYLAAQDSEKTLASIKTTVAGKIGGFASNENFCYILSGNDFNLNPIEDGNPKSICVSNVFNLREVLSPIVVLLFNSVARKFEFGNTTPFVFFMDEATTFKIHNFESYPSELREYKVAFVFLTQSAGKVEKLYTKFDRSSLESNLANQFYGWTADTIATDNYAKQFSKIEEKRRSYTTGGGRNSRSTTTSTLKEIRFDTEFFGSLKPGQFVGKAKNANVKTFHTRFKPYQDGKLDELPIVRNVTKEDLKKHYQDIILTVKNLI